MPVRLVTERRFDGSGVLTDEFLDLESKNGDSMRIHWSEGIHMLRDMERALEARR